jgi:hypothetical protein
MRPKRVVQQLRKESYKEASNLRSEMLPGPQVIDPDHTNKRMNPDLPRTDSLVLLSDGAPPSPHSPTGFIPTSDGPASYSTFTKNAKEAHSRREVEKRLAETAAEADRHLHIHQLVLYQLLMGPPAIQQMLKRLIPVGKSKND